MNSIIEFTGILISIWFLSIVVAFLAFAHRQNN